MRCHAKRVQVLGRHQELLLVPELLPEPRAAMADTGAQRSQRRGPMKARRTTALMECQAVAPWDSWRHHAEVAPRCLVQVEMCEMCETAERAERYRTGKAPLLVSETRSLAPWVGEARVLFQRSGELAPTIHRHEDLLDAMSRLSFEGIPHVVAIPACLRALVIRALDLRALASSGELQPLELGHREEWEPFAAAVL